MPVKLARLHPFRFSQLAEIYDQRAKRSADQARKIVSRFGRSPETAAAHEKMMLSEYGRMSSEEFADRIDMARSINALTQRWHSGGNLVFDVSQTSAPARSEPGGFGSLLPVTFSTGIPIYFHLGRAIGPALENDRARFVDGAYATRNVAVDDNSWILTFVCNSTPSAPRPRNLGELLRAQSAAVQFRMPHLDRLDAEIVAGDPDLLTNSAFQSAWKILVPSVERLYIAADGRPEPAVNSARLGLH